VLPYFETFAPEPKVYPDQTAPVSLDPKDKIYSRIDDEPTPAPAAEPTQEVQTPPKNYVELPAPPPQRAPLPQQANPKLDPAGKCEDFKNIKDRDALKELVLERIKQITEQVNEEFGKNPDLAAGQLSGAELNAFAETFGVRKTPSGVEILSEAAFNIAYGHILERLVADQVMRDPCLSKYIEYVKNVRQTDELPDFVGKNGAEGLEIDITTQGQAARKFAQGKTYQFVEYQRKLMMNAEGYAVPR
jgi:hypothetical protein